MVHLFIGATLAATSVGIPTRVLRNLGALRAAVLLAACAALGHSFSQHLVRLAGRLGHPELLLVVGLSVCFTLAFAAEAIGLAAIVGAFVAGFVIDPYGDGMGTRQKSATLNELVHPIAAVFVLLFLVLMGLQVDVASLASPSAISLAPALLLVAVLGKLACGLGVLDRGVDRLSVAVGMVPRGEVGLIFAGIGATLCSGAARSSRRTSSSWSWSRRSSRPWVSAGPCAVRAPIAPTGPAVSKAHRPDRTPPVRSHRTPSGAMRGGRCPARRRAALERRLGSVQDEVLIRVATGRHLLPSVLVVGGDREVTDQFALTLTILAGSGAFVSGFVGIGGAVVMIPLLYYIPPLLGVGALDVKQVSGLTAVQVLVAASAGAWTHGRRNLVNRTLAIRGGIAMAVGSLAGSVGSHFVSGRLLLMVFAATTTLAVPLMLVQPADFGDLSDPSPAPSSLRSAIVSAAIIGCLAGFVGAGGAFLLMPVMIGLLRLPVRVSIATSLVMTAGAAAAGLAGKVATGQVPLGPASVVIAGSLIGGVLGARASGHAPVALLRGVLVTLIALVTLRLWCDVLLH